MDSTQVSPLVRYINAACLTLCLYEYACIFSREVTLIWKATWNIPKVLYLLARFLPPILFLLMVYTASTSKCALYEMLFTWGANICICASEAIFALRTWAVWDRSRRMTISLSIIFLIVWAVNFAAMGIRSGDASTYRPLDQCWEADAQYPIPAYMLLALSCFYFLTFWLTVIKAYQNVVKPLGTVTSLMRVVHLDGLAYYLYLFGMSVATIVSGFGGGATLASNFANSFLMLQVTMSSILSCRMLLRLRDHASRTVRGLGSQERTSTSGFTLPHLDPLVFGHADLNLDADESALLDEDISLH